MKLSGFISVALLAAILTHLAVIFLAPDFIMRAAIERIGPPHTWRHPPRVSENSRAIVRPSPDLAYSACVFDLNGGPVRVSTRGWDDYVSVSLYAANGDNFFTVSDREAPDGIDLLVVRPGTTLPAAVRERIGRIVESPSLRGVAVARRLAPSAARFAAAADARKGDVCAPLGDT